MLYTDALLETRARLQELSADFWLDNELYRAINEGIMRFSLEEKWPWYFTAKTAVAHAANTATLGLEAGVSFERVFNLGMSFSGDTRMRQPHRVHPAEGFELRAKYGTAASEPLAYYITTEATASGVYTATVRFVPVVNRASTIEYTYLRRPTVVAAPTNQHLDVPEEWAMGVCAYAAGHAFLKELNFSQKADEQFALYQKTVSDAKREMRKISPDSGLVWGRQQPQYGWTDPSDELLYSVPDTLG